MLKEDIIKYIEVIDEELRKNDEFMRTHKNEGTYMIMVPTKLLIDARKMLVNILKQSYGIYYM